MSGPFGNCLSCGTPLLQRGGYGSVTELCGPCCTGEADTAGETTEDKPDFFDKKNKRKETKK